MPVELADCFRPPFLNVTRRERLWLARASPRFKIWTHPNRGGSINSSGVRMACYRVAMLSRCVSRPTYGSNIAPVSEAGMLRDLVNPYRNSAVPEGSHKAVLV